MGDVMELHAKLNSFRKTFIECVRETNRLRRRITWFFLYNILLLYPRRRELLLDCIREMFKNCNTPVVISASLSPVQGMNSRDGHGRIHWDAPMSITLWTAEGALVGLSVEFWCNELYIRQLQGMKGVTIPHDLRKWDRIFVEGCKMFAKRARIKAVRLSRPTNLLSAKLSQLEILSVQQQEELKEIHGRKKRRYDGTARTTGLKISKSGRWNVWYTSQDKA
jgi:hypothetical protein